MKEAGQFRRHACQQNLHGHLRCKNAGYGLRGDHAVAARAFRAIKPLVGATTNGIAMISMSSKSQRGSI